jgi:thioredoxin reductase (NADPH)
MSPATSRLNPRVRPAGLIAPASRRWANLDQILFIVRETAARMVAAGRYCSIDELPPHEPDDRWRGPRRLGIVITTEEIGNVAVFASLSEAEREQICRAAADVRLVPGDYAAHEGDERALFAVIEGRIEPVRTVDGVDRVLGERLVGDIFGEVPIVLGTVFPVGFRAAEPTRVMRLEPRDYHALAAAVPEVSKLVGNLANYRMGGTRGLSALAAEQRPPRAVVVGSRSDAQTTALRHFLDRNQVSFTWVSDESEGVQQAWGGPLPSSGDWPVIRVVDGKTVVRPRLRRVAELLGLGTEPEHAAYDAVIVGAGPAGLAAAVYGASEGLATIVVEREAPGGQAGTSSRIENYLGFPSGVSGAELASRALSQARRLGAEILVTRSISRIDVATRQVHLDDGDVIASKTIILACGVSWRQMNTDGFDRLVGKGIYYGAARSEAAATHGLDVHIIGAGNSAAQAAMHFSTHARTVTILCRGDDLQKSMSQYLIDQLKTRPNIHIALQSQVTASHGDSTLQQITIHNNHTNETRTVNSAALFIFIGADAQTDWLPAEIALDKRGYVLTGTDMRTAGHWTQNRDPYLLETSIPGIFACGDVRYSPIKRVAAAVGEGSMTIAFVHQYLKDPSIEWSAIKSGRAEPALAR